MSQGRAQPPRSNSADNMPAVNPHTSSPETMKRGSDVAGRVLDPQPVGGIGQRGERDAHDGGGLAEVDGVDAARTGPVGQHRGDREARRRQVELRQDGERDDAGRVEAGLLLGLAQRGGDRAGVAAFGAAAGERDLARVRTQGAGPLGEQHVGAVGGGLAEQHEDGGAAGVGGRGFEVVGEQVGAVDVEERVEQRSQPGGRSLRIERAHDSTLPGARRRVRVGATMER